MVNARGERIFETRLKPTVAIDPAAAAVHGISDEDLVRAPSWPDIAQQLQHHIGRRPLVIFNAEFDTRILKQTAAAHNDPASWLDSLTCTVPCGSLRVITDPPIVTVPYRFPVLSVRLACAGSGRLIPPSLTPL
nr:3'-5' exonuclease [Escherichia coli]